MAQSRTALNSSPLHLLPFAPPCFPIVLQIKAPRRLAHSSNFARQFCRIWFRKCISILPIPPDLSPLYLRDGLRGHFMEFRYVQLCFFRFADSHFPILFLSCVLFLS